MPNAISNDIITIDNLEIKIEKKDNIISVSCRNNDTDFLMMSANKSANVCIQIIQYSIIKYEIARTDKDYTGKYAYEINTLRNAMIKAFDMFS